MGAETFIIDLLAFFGIYLIVTTSLNLEIGYGGVPNFGKHLAVLGGAFVAGTFPGRLGASLMGLGELDYIAQNPLIVTSVSQGLANNVPLALLLFIVTLALAAAVGAALGFIASYPARRLREIYLGITLLVMAEGLLIIGYFYEPLIGGTLGISIPDLFAWTGGLRFTVFTFVILAIALLLVFYAELLARSPFCRVLRAVRDNEVAAASLGKDIAGIRMRVLVIGSSMGAIGGALHALRAGSAIATAYGMVGWTFWPWVMVLLGGIANNVGVIAGTFAFVTIRRLIIFYKGVFQPYLPFDVVWLDYMLLGLALILILMFKTEGIIPEKPTRTISPRRIEELTKGLRPRERSEFVLYRTIFKAHEGAKSGQR